MSPKELAPVARYSVRMIAQLLLTKAPACVAGLALMNSRQV